MGDEPASLINLHVNQRADSLKFQMHHRCGDGDRGDNGAAGRLPKNYKRSKCGKRDLDLRGWDLGDIAHVNEIKINFFGWDKFFGNLVPKM
jgi:hypothetical protein